MRVNLLRRLILADKLPCSNLKVLNRFKSTITINTFAKQYDQTQLNLLEEKCILVNVKDQEIGMESKMNCHLLKHINKGMLHRAFSVFLFDSNKNLLLQQRSLSKITYPNHWTNTCCSHPLYTKEERDGAYGVKRAAIRRLNYELGMEIPKIKLESLHYLTRIQYKAENMPKDGIFGENEIDYVLFMTGDFDLNPNQNEVKAVKYVSMYELKEMIQEEKNSTSAVQLTPWFKLIAENFLFDWWKKLENLESIKDHKIIHTF
jgi:isopentenyl-diphosphate delta-isomerase